MTNEDVAWIVKDAKCAEKARGEEAAALEPTPLGLGKKLVPGFLPRLGGNGMQPEKGLLVLGGQHIPPRGGWGCWGRRDADVQVRSSILAGRGGEEAGAPCSWAG